MKRILIVTTRQIGDVLLTTPLIRASRELWPLARIEVIGFEGTLGILQANADIDALVTTPARFGPLGLFQFLRRLWRQYDLALVAQPGDRSHLIGWAAARQCSGIVPSRSGSNWWKKRLLRHVVVSAGDRGAVHVVQENVALLAPWRTSEPTTIRVVPPSAASLPHALEAQLQPGAVAIHVPSMWRYKQWSQAHFKTLVQGLLDGGHQIVLTGSGAERDQACIAPLRALAAAPRLIDTSGKLNFNQLTALFGRVALYIGPDTSVSHLAAATGVPMIAIFGPTNPMRWAPWPARSTTADLFARSSLAQQVGNVTLLQSNLPCVPCGRAGCEDHRDSRSDCLDAITPERVLDQAERLLARTG
jgi:heptosyltransferase-3